MSSTKLNVNRFHYLLFLQFKVKSVFFFLVITCFLISANTQANDFRAAVVKVDITPNNPQMLLGYQARQSTGIHDRIYHKILLLDDGKTQFFIISSDLCLISPSEYDKVTGILQRTLKINPLQVWWTVTHTHSAPEVGPPGLPAAFLGERYTHAFDTAYTALVERKLIEGITAARKNLVPASLGVGWGHAQANINRRARDIDNQTFLGMNPDGPVDRRIGMLRIDKEDGSPLALIANYAIHGTVMSGANLKISGDAPGVVAAYVEEQLGAPLLFINGAAGNIAPIYSVYPSPGAGHLNQFRAMLGKKIIDAYKAITSTTNNVNLQTGALTVETPMKEGLQWPDELKGYKRTTKAGAKIIQLPVRFLKINDDVAIWSAPLELFCEVSNEIRDRSPFPYTFYFGYTNGWLGYLLTEEELKYGGYEPTVSPYSPSAARDLTESVTNHLQGKMPE